GRPTASLSWATAATHAPWSEGELSSSSTGSSSTGSSSTGSSSTGSSSVSPCRLWTKVETCWPRLSPLGLAPRAADMDSEMSAAAPNRASHRERNLIDMDRSSCDEQLVDAIAPDEYLTSVSATHLIAGGTWVRVRGRLCGEGGLS